MHNLSKLEVDRLQQHKTTLGLTPVSHEQEGYLRLLWANVTFRKMLSYLMNLDFCCNKWLG